MTLKQFKTARNVEDEFVVSVDDHKNKKVVERIAEMENMSFSDLLMLPCDKIRMFADLSQPLILLSPLHNSPAPLFIGSHGHI